MHRILSVLKQESRIHWHPSSTRKIIKKVFIMILTTVIASLQMDFKNEIEAAKIVEIMSVLTAATVGSSTGLPG
jgi:hypothetical protein